MGYTYREGAVSDNGADMVKAIKLMQENVDEREERMKDCCNFANRSDCDSIMNISLLCYCARRVILSVYELTSIMNIKTETEIKNIRKLKLKLQLFTELK